MPLFTRRDLDRLLGPHEPPCVSLYMPTHPVRSDARQNPIRFKHLLHRAQSLLGTHLDAPAARAVIEPLEDLSRPEFWRERRAGLAVFGSRDFTADFEVPIELPELAIVSDTFHVKPLLRFLRGHRRYLALALGQKNTRLYEGTAFDLRPVDVAGLPRSLADAPGTDLHEPFQTRHTTGMGKGGKAGTVVYGHEGVETLKKADLVQFFSAVDRALRAVLREESAPLVLTGVGYYFPLYREANTYRNLVADGAEGSADGASIEDLRARVWPIVERWFDDRENEALAEYRDLLGRGHGTDALKPIAKAAVGGRVRRLFLADDARVWGRLDRTTGRVALHAEQTAGDDDLLDELAEVVLARGGEVLALPRGRMPDGSPVAAELRW